MDITFSNVRGTLRVNGVVIAKSSGSIGKNVVIKSFVDGKEVPLEHSPDISIEVDGDVNSIATTSGDVTANKTKSIKTVSGDVKCGSVKGDVATVSGDVISESIAGNIRTTSGDVKIRAK